MKRRAQNNYKIHVHIKEEEMENNHLHVHTITVPSITERVIQLTSNSRWGVVWGSWFTSDVDVVALSGG